MDGKFVFKQFNAILAESPKNLLWFVLPVKICLMSSSHYTGAFLRMAGKGTKGLFTWR